MKKITLLRVIIFMMLAQQPVYATLDVQKIYNEVREKAFKIQNRQLTDQEKEARNVDQPIDFDYLGMLINNLKPELMPQSIMLQLKKLYDFSVMVPEYLKNRLSMWEQWEKFFPVLWSFLDKETYKILEEDEKRAESELKKITEYIRENVGDFQELKGDWLPGLRHFQVWKCKDIFFRREFSSHGMREYNDEEFCRLTKAYENLIKENLEYYQKKEKRYLDSAQHIIKEVFPKKGMSLLRNEMKRVCDLEFSKEGDKDKKKRKEILIECVLEELELLIKKNLFSKVSQVVNKMFDNIKCVQGIDRTFVVLEKVSDQLREQRYREKKEVGWMRRDYVFSEDVKEKMRFEWKMDTQVALECVLDELKEAEESIDKIKKEEENRWRFFLEKNDEKSSETKGYVNKNKEEKNNDQ